MLYLSMQASSNCPFLIDSSFSSNFFQVITQVWVLLLAGLGLAGLLDVWVSLYKSLSSFVTDF